MPKFEITQVTSAPAIGATGYQSQLPSTGEQLITKALVNAGTALNSIAGKLIDAKLQNEVAEADLTATKSLVALGTELGRQGNDAVVQNFDAGSQEIFQKVAGNMSPAALNAFKPRYNKLVASNFISAQAAGVKRDHAHVIGKTMTILDGYRRLVETNPAYGPTAEVSVQTGIVRGTSLIETLLAIGAIDGKQRAKMLIDHQSKMASGAVTGWITRNATSFATMNAASIAIASGKIPDQAVAAHWKTLLPKEKEAIRIKVRSELRNMATISDRADKQIAVKTEGAAGQLKRDFHNILTTGHPDYMPFSPERTDKLNGILSKLDSIAGANPDAAIITRPEYATMQHLVKTGGVSGQRDPQKYRAMLLQVIRGKVTESQIWLADGLTTDDKAALVDKLAARQDRTFAEAVKLIETDPIFLTTSSGRLHRLMLTQEQAMVENQFHHARIKARQENKPFDAYSTMIDLIKNFKAGKTVGAEAANEAQTKLLEDLGISGDAREAWDQWRAIQKANKALRRGKKANAISAALTAVHGPEPKPE